MLQNPLNLRERVLAAAILSAFFLLVYGATNYHTSLRATSASGPLRGSGTSRSCRCALQRLTPLRVAVGFVHVPPVEVMPLGRQRRDLARLTGAID